MLQPIMSFSLYVAVWLQSFKIFAVSLSHTLTGVAPLKTSSQNTSLRTFLQVHCPFKAYWFNTCTTSFKTRTLNRAIYCIYVFLIIPTSNSGHFPIQPDRLVFLIEAYCVLCEVQNQP
jgi:hypothetical protein